MMGKPRSVTTIVNGQQALFSSVVPINGGYTVNNLSVGVKANPWRHLLLLGNIAIKLDSGGCVLPLCLWRAFPTPSDNNPAIERLPKHRGVT